MTAHSEPVSQPIAAKNPRESALRSRVPGAIALLIGAAVAATGFTPFSNLPDVLDIEQRPSLVVLTAPVLVASLAVGAALLYPKQPTLVPGDLVGGAVLLVLGAALSVMGSDHPTSSALTAVLAVSAPMILFTALVHSAVPLRAAAAGFLGATCLLMLRADAVFVRDWGFPTFASLFEAKFASTPYDFHYYSLGNPDHTAGFLLLPLALAVFWAVERGPALRPWPRRLLLVAAALLLGSLVLLYSRSAIFTAAVLVACAVWTATRGTARRAAVAALVAILALLAVGGGDYLLDLFSTASTSAGGERVASLGEGLEALADNPLTGVGLGRYGPAGGYFNAHSSIVQAGAEMGVVGLSALLLLTAALIRLAVATVRRRGARGPVSAAAIGVGVYAAYAAVAAPANEGLYSGYVATWGLALALLLALAHEPDPA